MITVGCDPEGFLRDPESGKIIPSTGLVGGSKDDPRIVKCGAFQEDNIMWEINTTPANSEDEWVHVIQTVLQQLREHVAPLELLIEPWVMLDAPLDGADMFGCSPDYNVYRGEENPTINAEMAGLMRTASGNIHIGFDHADDHPAYRLNVVRALDVYLGVPSVLLEPDGRRRELYGKAGAYRPTPYGVEYRVTSNFWLTQERYMRFVYQQVRFVVENYSTRDVGENPVPYAVCEVIDLHQKEQARELCEWYGIVVP